MKKALLSLAVLGAILAGHADDIGEYAIFWQVDDAYVSSVKTQVGTDWTYDVAALVAELDDSGKIYLGSKTPVGGGNLTTDDLPSSLANASSPITSFYVEFYALNGSNGYDLIGRSDVSSIATVAHAINDFRGEGTAGGTLAHTGLYTPTGYQAIPEPSSGLLFLIGLAGLALKRRRRA